MKENLHSGKLIVFEGLDGSGKATQTNLLIKYLESNGYKIATIDFPQYGTKSAGLVENYLNGLYGNSNEVTPYQASVFYACDRYDASFKIRKWLEEKRIVVCDRYVASSIGHQGGKIKDDKERKEFLKWLYNLEYGIFKIPKPDLTFILKTSPQIAWKMVAEVGNEEKRKKREFYLGTKVRDIHEADLLHLKPALDSYLEVAKEFPQDFKIIECLKDEKLLSPETIHQEIIKYVKEIL